MIALTFASFTVQAQTIRYVTPSGAGERTGAGWANASNNLQDMINKSSAGDEIRVAAGWYSPQWTANGYNASTSTFPTTDGGSANAFVLKEGVKVYGGFAGTETSLSGRSEAASVLSGGNCCHVVIGEGITSATVLDCFFVTCGNANGNADITVNGYNITGNNSGGIYNVSSSPTLVKLTVSENSAYEGGGMYNTSKSSSTCRRNHCRKQRSQRWRNV